MRSNIVIFWLLSAFFLFAGALYVGWSYFEDPNVFNDLWGGTHREGFWVGTIAFLLSSILAAFIAFFLWLNYRRQAGQQLPEDRLDADIDDGDSELGHFSPWSWWPIVLAFAAGLMFLGLAVGAWLMLYSVPILVVALVGWVFEYTRGNFAH